METMLALSIGAIVIISASAVLGWTARSQSRANAKIQMEINKLNVLNNLSSPASWEMTVSKNQPAMSCLLPNAAAPCAPNQPVPFSLWDASGALILDGTSPTSGFTLQGDRCDQFDINNGNVDCPFRYALQWSAVCDPSGTPSCFNPQVLVNAHLLYRPGAAAVKIGGIDEDGLSINSMYLPATTCTGGAQQAFFYNSSGTAPLNLNFVVPTYTKNLYVEAWGGGGGGPSFNWLSNSYVAGSPGGDTTFIPAAGPTVIASGGPGAYTEALSERSWWFALNFGFFFLWSGSCDGFPGGDPNATLLNGIRSCAPLGASLDGGNGGLCDISPIFTAPRNGSLYGGGGASGGAWLTNCADWAFLYVPQTSDNGGRYSSGTYTPATLPPGTVVPITVGGGGAGAVGTTFTSCWGAIPAPAGSGANGLVKITWE